MRTVLAVLCLFLAACGDWESASDREQREKQESISQQANAQTGMPGITNFTEKKLMRKLYEPRDKEIATFTYVPDMNGKLWHLCDSIGYGLPYGTQYSSPQKMAGYTGHEFAMPQSEPNSLFMPPTAEGTWVICGTKDDLKPVYVEPKVIVSPFKLRAEGEYFVK